MSSSRLRSNPRDHHQYRSSNGNNSTPVSSNPSRTTATTATAGYTTPLASSNDTSSATSDSMFSAAAVSSVTSSYRHHNAGPFMPPNSSSTSIQHADHPSSSFSSSSFYNNNYMTTNYYQPKPVLVKDAQYKPKTTGSVGIMLVGLGGANGTTLLAGVLANRFRHHTTTTTGENGTTSTTNVNTTSSNDNNNNFTWHGPTGEPREPNWYGCITQLKSCRKGYQDKVRGLADATLAAVGGWDIRPTKPGDALLQARILDYDLVRQIKDEMNKVKVFRGVYDPRFIGSSQHETATHVLTKEEIPTDAEALKCLRADIRYFKWRNGVVGHTTVIWSASVEPNCELVEQWHTAQELLDAIEMSADERGGPLPPSLLYATAALLEGCSFINGGSQNTLSCPGLADLARQQLGVYCLGTDFKAGQTKFKTAAVEYLRTIGLKPRVIASSNHLGNNDMRNLASSKTTSTAKLRVKHDIFEPWQEEDLDHKVSIMFTEYINDDKRDFVEYTSLGFLGQPHTMVTYTRASDSVLCVPLMIDGAVWCDYFSRCSWPYDKVARALAYLFKIPEGAAKGVDPGFFKQMQELDNQVMAAHTAKNGLKRDSSIKKKRVRIRPDEKATEWAIPHDANIICAGLACVDMQLYHATGGDGGENIETFEGEKSIGGGSVSMACKTLARLCHGAPLDEGYMQVTPPVVHSVIPLCKVGPDGTGDKLIELLQKSGEACRNVECRYIKASRNRDPNARTALAVLPIYEDGRRGCFFDAASNTTFSARELVEMMESLSTGSSGPLLDTSNMSADDIENYHADLEQMTPIYGAFLFGYPHLLPNMQGEALAQILLEARSKMIDGGIIAVDLNGVPEDTFQKREGLRSVIDLKNDPVLGSALEHIDILHMNIDELCLLTGCEIKGTPDSVREDDFAIGNAINLFLLCGVAIVAVTRGRAGSYVTCNDEERFRRSTALPSSWVDCSAKVGAVQLPKGTLINSNGAGDSFTAGLLVATMLRHTGMTVPTIDDTPTVANKTMESSDRAPTTPPPSKKPQKKMTPYALYMQENYVTLKSQLNDDKKAIFSRCHEMWENETNEVKSLYERRAAEENEDDAANETNLKVMTDMETLDTSYIESIQETPRNMYMTNRSLNLESAVQFASFVAAYHVNVSTRDRTHVDISHIVERAMVLPTTLEEI